MPKKDKTSEDFTDREIISIRVVKAPRELVWRAMAEPEHLAQWWGPNGFTNTFREFEFRPGGNWHFVMHGPNGVNFENESVFTEIVKPERIVFEHLRPMHWFQMAMTLRPQDEGTEVTWRMGFETVEEYNKIKDFVVPANEQNLDRLEAYLARMR